MGWFFYKYLINYYETIPIPKLKQLKEILLFSPATMDVWCYTTDTEEKSCTICIANCKITPLLIHWLMIYRIRSNSRALRVDIKSKGCAWVQAKKRKKRHLASRGRNLAEWHLLAVGGTKLNRKFESWCCGWWRTWFRSVFERIYPRYCLNCRRNCLELLYRQVMIDLEGWFCNVACVI